MGCVVPDFIHITFWESLSPFRLSNANQQTESHEFYAVNPATSIGQKLPMACNSSKSEALQPRLMTKIEYIQDYL